MALDWTDDLVTGNAEIDADHQEFLRKIEAFQETYRAGRLPREQPG
jgi:hemerythrin